MLVYFMAIWYILRPFFGMLRQKKSGNSALGDFFTNSSGHPGGESPPEVAEKNLVPAITHAQEGERLGPNSVLGKLAARGLKFCTWV
jgi:hypothetical protein